MRLAELGYLPQSPEPPPEDAHEKDQEEAVPLGPGEHLPVNVDGDQEGVGEEVVGVDDHVVPVEQALQAEDADLEAPS